MPAIWPTEKPHGTKYVLIGLTGIFYQSRGATFLHTKFFEIGMLLCFGAAWPASIYKSYTARSAKGKSVLFLGVIALGYISGIINKLINSPDYVMYLYLLNLIMVSTDMVLYFRNKRLDEMAEKEKHC
jgi:hypothetical protein